MTEYSELVKALRHCATRSNGCVTCAGCPMSSENGDVIECINALHKDSTAAIEELQSILTEADKKQAYQHDYICELVAEKEELQAETERLKAQLPKRGEWIVRGANRVDCSVCGHSICFAFGLSEGSLTGYNYCPNCGAKMTGEQDVE